MSQRVSVSPDGETFQLPGPEDYQKEFERFRERVRQEREKGREIVVVMGIGFVGTVMAAIVADTTDADENPTKFVIGMQRPSVRSFWKIPLLNRGESPVKAEDPEVDPMIRRYFQLGCEVKGLGRGHIQRIKESVRKASGSA